MLEVLPLPLVWLGAFLVSQALAGKSVETHRIVITVVSIAALVLGCGFWDGTLYLALGTGILLAGQMLVRLDGRGRQIAFAASIIGTTLMIVVFLGFRTYVLKYFLYLPSLSYLGFRGISYLTSVYRREEVPISTAAMQMFFFPMLFTGPISRVENFEKTHADYTQVLKRLIAGLAMLTIGYLLKQFVLPQHILLRQSAVYIPTGDYWASVFANSFELYFTFAGYSHIVIGLSLLLGFQLPENFNNPYMASSISEFWRKWHMSLSFWIRDYLYIPLGGNRYGLIRKCFNLLVAMAICGVWHGLSANFLIWGLYHGALLSFESIFRHFKLEPLSVLPNWLSRPIRIIRTFAFVTFGWLLFMYSLPAFQVHVKGLIP